MKTKPQLLMAGVLLTTAASGLSQPNIAFQPTNFPSVSLGASTGNRVVATGTGALSYQWRLNGAPISGRTTFAIALSNVQLADVGDYDVVVTDTVGSTTSQVSTLDVDPTFTKITTGVIVNDAEGSNSGNWADYDNDGYPDVFVANWVFSGNTRNALYHNNGGTNFTRVTTGPVTTDLGRVWEAAWGDYDNDGNVDLIAGYIDGGVMAQRLYRNNGGGNFTVVVDPALRSDTTGAASPWWFDYDNDGFLDLFVAKGALSAANDCVFRNNGDGTFRKMTTAEVGPIVTDGMRAEACFSADFDNDGRQELTIVNRPQSGGNPFDPLTWRPQADGTFVTTQLGIPSGTLAAWWGDYDNDGWLDIFGETTAANRQPRLYRNSGTGEFADTTAALNATTPVPPVAAAWGDYDNDGWLDLFFARVYWYSTNTVNGFFRNKGDGTFTQILTGSLVFDGENTLSPSWIDYNNDGFLDCFIAVGDGVAQKNRLYRNNGNTNHWLKLTLDGRASNRSGIGAKVLVQGTVNGKTFWQVREISCANSYNGQNGLIAHFGLGDATNVTTLEIRWPSGIVQTLTNVAADQFLTVEEHQQYGGPAPGLTNATRTSNGLELSILEPAAPAVYALEASTDLVTWTKLLARTSGGSTFDYTDTRATNYARRFYRVVVP